MTRVSDGSHTFTCHRSGWLVWRSGSVDRRMNEVTLR